MAHHHKNSQFPLFNSHFVPQMWLNVPNPTYGGYSYQQCFDQANYNLLMNSILMKQRENQQLRTKLQMVETKLRSEMSLKIHEMPNCGTECAKNLQEKNEKISILEEELTKMIDKFGKLVKKDSELLLESVKCIHEPEEITNLKQKLSEMIINIENEREVNSVNAKRLLEKEEEMSNLEAELAEMKYKIEKESELKKENTIRLQEKEEEIANLDQQLSEIAISIEKEREVNREENTKCLDEQEEEEIAKLKQELSKLSSYVQELNRQVHERNAKLNAFSVINDMLVSSIESRDETIVQYKKKLQKNTKDTSSSDVDSLLGNLSPLQTSSPVLNAVKNIENSGYNPLPETLSTPEESNSPTMSVALTPSNALQNNKAKSSTSKLDPRPKEFVTPSMQSSLKSWNGAHKWRFAKTAVFDIATPEAGNTTESWTCLHCDKNTHPLKFVSYTEYRQHLIEIHNEVLDPALCVKCGWRSSNGLDLDFHMYKQHQIPSLFYSFSKNEFSTSLLAK